MKIKFFGKTFKTIAFLIPAACSAVFAQWNGTASEPIEKNVIDGKVFYTITSAEELTWVGVQVKNGFNGINVVLANDIVFGADSSQTSSRLWTPIGKDTTTAYAGTFDGAGHTIYGYYVEQGTFAGLFGALSPDGVIKNLRVANNKVTVTEAIATAGGIVAFNRGLVDNCENSGTVDVTTKAYAAGGVAGINEGVVSNSSNYGAITSKHNYQSLYAGGVVGANRKTIHDCENHGTVYTESTNKAAVYAYAGGIAGFTNRNSQIYNSVNYGSVTSKTTMTSEGGFQNGTRAGGIVSFNQYGKVFDCVNHGDVVAATVLVPIDIDNDCIAGGIAGGNEGSLYRNFNDGSIISRNSYNNSGTNIKYTSAGGIVGLNRTPGKVYECENAGSVTVSSVYSYFWTYAGGIVGRNLGFVERSSNRGNIIAKIASTSTKAGTSSYSTAGGVVGASRGTVSDVFNTGSVTVTKVATASYAGGILGSLFGSEKLTNSYNASSNITGTLIGAVSAYVTESSHVQNCHYDASLFSTKTPAIKSVGGSATVKDTSGLKTDNMKSDEMAWILNTVNNTEKNRKVWGREDSYPVFANESVKPIFRVTMNNDGEISHRYARGEMSFKSYPQGIDGYTFVAWIDKNGEPFVSGSEVTEDMTLIAKYVLAESSSAMEESSSATAESSSAMEESSSATASSSSEATSSSAVKPSSSASADKVSSSSVSKTSSSSATKTSSSSANKKSSSSVASSSSSKPKSSSSGKSSSSEKSDAILAGAKLLNFTLHVEGRQLFITTGRAYGAAVDVLDMQGRLIEVPHYTKGNVINLTLPRSGSYILKVAGQTKQVTVK